MERKVRYILLIVVFFVATVSLSGCKKKTSQAPPKQMVQDTLRASLPPFLSLDSVELEPIPTGPESVKVNFKAIVTPKEDLYQVDREVEGTPKEDLYQGGIGAVSLDSEVEGTPKVTLLKVIQTAGTKASLYGSVEANRTMDIWTLESPQIQVGLEQFGAPRGAFPAQSYIAGSSEANAALKEQAANAERQERARQAALEQREREQKAQQERETREQKERQEREEQARIAMEEQQKKEDEQRQKEEEAARQKLILATVPGTRYIGTISERDKRQRLRLVFTEQQGVLIRAEASNPDIPTEKQSFTGELVSNPQPEKGSSVAYPIVMSPVETKTYFGGDNTLAFYYHPVSLKLRLTDTGLEGEAHYLNDYTIRLQRGDIKSQAAGRDERAGSDGSDERERIRRERIREQRR